MKTFESRLDDLLLLSGDWRTNAIFKSEAARLVKDIMTRTATTENRATLARDLGGLQAVIEIQDRWLKNQLMTLHDPMPRRPEVTWIM